MSFLRTPPGTALVSLACAAASVIAVASYAAQGHVPLAAPVVLVAAAGLFSAVAAWRGRGLVARNIAVPTLLAAAVAVGFLELVFAYDGTPGKPLTVLTCALVLVALDLPLLISTYGATV